MSHGGSRVAWSTSSSPATDGDGRRLVEDVRDDAAAGLSLAAVLAHARAAGCRVLPDGMGRASLTEADAERLAARLRDWGGGAA